MSSVPGQEGPPGPTDPHPGLRLLLVKLGARGDVLRTTPLLTALRRSEPGAHLTWVTRRESIELLRPLEEIDRLVALDAETAEALAQERFDRVLCLDEAPEATALATRVACADKRGYVQDGEGRRQPANADAEYAHRLTWDDELKFRRNTRTHQDVAFEMAGLPWRGEPYRLEVPAAAAARAAERWAHCGLAAEARPVGLNVGAADVFAHKDWRVAGFAELARAVRERLGRPVALLGGPLDRARVEAVAAQASEALVPEASESVLEFAALVGRCAAVVTGDTLGMHVAIARRVPVVAIFGSTCPQEIELYGRGERIVPEIACHPCYKRACEVEPSCADRVSSGTVFDALSRVLGQAR